MKVFLLIGQSNMAGPQTCRPDESDDARLRGVYLLNKEGEWEPAKNTLNRYSTIMPKEYNCGLNPGVTFAETLKKRLSGEKIGLICNAKGATKLSEWQKGTPYFYETIKRALQGAKDGELAGVLWLQGEQDTIEKVDYTTYGERFAEFIEDLRRALDNPDLPFIMGEIWGEAQKVLLDWNEGTRAVNRQIRSVARHVPDTAWVTTKRIAYLPHDPVHFAPEGMRVLGRRYARAYIDNWLKD